MFAIEKDLLKFVFSLVEIKLEQIEKSDCAKKTIELNESEFKDILKCFLAKEIVKDFFYIWSLKIERKELNTIWTVIIGISIENIDTKTGLVTVGFEALNLKTEKMCSISC